MSDSENPDHVELEEPEEKNSVFVVDPDDYQKTRKLKAINDAKDQVAKLRNEKPTTAKSRDWKGIHHRTSEAVAMYGHELIPLIEDAIAQDVIDEEDLETRYGDLREFIKYDGRLADEEGEEFIDMKPAVYMAFYRQLERIQRELGLGLELREDMGPAEI